MIGFIRHGSKHLFLLLVTSVVVGVITICGLVCFILRSRVIEMHLRAALIKQMEATRQAESKSMSKSNAFAQASHDVRASLAGIIGLIDMSYEEVSPSSELEKNLKQMEACAKDLLGFLNGILDSSKVEAGKMPLEEQEFDLAQLLEDVVDLYHPVAMRKGVDVVLDPNDGTVFKNSLVKGDRVKLKQILSNLLSNAVKFTDDGHISVRAWVQKPSLERLILTSSGDSWWKRLKGLFCERNDEDIDIDDEAVNELRQNPNSVEFVFEVDDTGTGIPKEMWKSVFENYIQVKERARGQEGTGLGLGIVQSLVRLMGGDIQIRNKDMGERGTCFRFNVFLAPCDAGATKPLEEDLEAGGYGAACHLGLTIHAHSPALSFHSSSTRQVRSPKLEGSLVVLLIQNEERRRTCQSYMEKLGIEVLVASQWQDLLIILKKVRMKVVNVAYRSSSSKSDISWRIERFSKSASCGKSCSRVRGISLSSLDGADQPVDKSSSHKDQAGFVLLIIDTTAGPFQEIFMAVGEFRELIPSIRCKVVWLDKPTMRNIDQRAISGKLDPDDIIMSKPFHGSRLLQVIRLLPEFGGSLQKRPSKQVKERQVHNAEATKPLAEETGNTHREKPLSGKRVLVVDDSEIMRKLALGNLSNLGATVQLCENGKEAVQLIHEGIDEQWEQGFLHIHHPYDYILMDCQMPTMDGYEATRKIRKEERQYGIHTPIIALTAHSSGAEVKKIFEAGMDFHIEKPPNRVRLMKAISETQSREGGVSSSASNV